jgi:adenylate kinase family enzyme
MEVYEEATRPLKAYYGLQGKLIQIDGSLNIEKVHVEIVHRLVKKLIELEAAAKASYSPVKA